MGIKLALPKNEFSFGKRLDKKVRWFLYFNGLKYFLLKNYHYIMSIIPALNWRYATKSFDPSKKISSESLQILVDSFVLTASSFGLQPWHLIVVSSDELKKKLQGHAWNQAQVGDCSHLFVLCARTDLTVEDGKELVELTSKTVGVPVENLAMYEQMLTGFLSSKNSEDLTDWAKKQVYIALGTLLVSAADLQIDTCPMEGFDPAAFDEILGLKEKSLAATVICPVGYRGDDKYASNPKVRYSQDKVVSFVE